MALPSQYYYACFPLQEYFVDKDTGFPLAAGYVEFFSDPDFTVPKNVYQQNQITGPTYQYVSLGSVLTLSSVGTFQDNSGIDIIPFLYPFSGTPSSNPNDIPTGTPEPYFIRVYSSGGILQFTREGWPPQFQTQNQITDTFESTQNAITNSQFSTVTFVSDTLNQVSYTYTTVGNYTFDVAPGWQLVTTGAGTITVKQLAVSTALNSGANAAYALEITTSGITDCKLVQRIINSPRLYQDLYVSACLTAACATDAVPIEMIYAPSNAVTPTLIMSQSTQSNGVFTQLIGVGSGLLPVKITTPDNFAPPAYIDIQITIPVSRTITITAVQTVTVPNETSFIDYIPQSVPQQTNTEFWYYRDRLAYKPIPSYTLGWNWPINPCQELGTTVAAASTLPGLSRYVADETIIFQNVDSSIACGFGSPGMGITPAISSSFAIIKYFNAAEAANILSTPLCVQLKAGSATTTDLIANVSIWYTFDANLPDIKSGSCYSLVSSVNNTTGVATVGGGGNHGTWYEVPRSNLGPAKVNLKTADVPVYDFNGWVYDDATPATSVTYCAIVISVSQLAAGVGCTFEYCTLNAGYIPTRPQADSFGENLTALQQFYEKSYDVDKIPASNTSNGIVFFAGNTYAAGGITYTYPCAFSVNYKTSKRTNALATFYRQTGTINQVDGIIVLAGSANTVGAFNTTTSPDWSFSLGMNGVKATPITNSSLSTGAVNPNSSAGIQFHYTADARLGIV